MELDTDIEYRKRKIENLIEKYLKIFGAVLIEGPRGCGKSTTGKYLANSYISLQKSAKTIKAIENDISIALVGEVPRLIDEWQLYPSIWDSVRYEVDNRNKKGQFLLCGSSVPDFDSKRHSGAMRIGRITMSTMSLEEMGISSCEVNFFDLINGVCINGAKEVLKSELIDVILKGGWPNNLYLTSYESMIATKNYITNIASVDLRSLTDRPSQERTIALIKALSRNITTSVSYETLARESQIIESPVSIRKYLDFLIRIFLIEELPVWKSHIRSSIQTKISPKLYFVDPSIVCASLSLNETMLLNDSNTLGIIFENLVIKELKLFCQMNGAEIYYFRDSSGYEVDAIIELNDGNDGWIAIEIKLGSDIGIQEGIKNLKNLKNKIKFEKMEKLKSMNIITGGSKSYTTEDGINVASIFHLHF